MGFLKRDKAPDELPGLALPEAKPLSQNFSAPDIAPVHSQNIIAPTPIQPIHTEQNNSSIPPLPRNEPKVEVVSRHVEAAPEKLDHFQEHEHKKQPVHGEDYLEFSHEAPHKTNHEDIKTKAFKHIDASHVNPKHVDIAQPKFFDQVLDDINGEIQDLGKLEDWYKNKFSSQDIVGNMKGYWEGNKADIIIQSFGAEYKKKIKENIHGLQALEEEWRVIYFNLIKKEEEMKKIEQDLKGTLAEFVDICKRKTTEDKRRKDERKEKKKE